MTYATATQLLDQFSAEEIAQRADQGIPRLVTAGMLATAAAGGSLSEYTQAEQDATLAALAVINNRLLDADSVINSYLATRYTLPLSTVPRVVMLIACDLARYALHDDQALEPITERYKDAIKRLKDMTSSQSSLGVDIAGNKPTVNDAAQMSSTTPVFRRDQGGFI
ncbi:gp436 family protein [Nitrosomonas communis]|uniref:Mu-like prophage protein gp36 n=1 Tax=Nitrosomonas communis TaxID=44574 RepID=A0A1I4SRT0_9PROT|nr:phage protein Gp36 family protein [Nitrosomonas communis]SFM67142.1 Mu-like prophage protein gp36 [Nitrosomonas communis]